jgi:pyruvate/oxaloacetate carboxyltransferase
MISNMESQLKQQGAGDRMKEGCWKCREWEKTWATRRW